MGERCAPIAPDVDGEEEIEVEGERDINEIHGEIMSKLNIQ